MAARKKKRELSEKAQKRIRQRNLHVGITVIAAIVIIFSVIQFTLWRYVSKADEEHICKNVFIGKTDVSGMTKEEAVKAVNNTLGDYRNKQLVATCTEGKRSWRRCVNRGNGSGSRKY